MDQIEENLYSEFVIIDKNKKLLKLDNQVFAEIDPVIDKELLENTKKEEKKNKVKLNFKNESTISVVLKKDKKKFDLKDFPGNLFILLK